MIYLLIFPFQFLYALGATLFFVILPARIFLPERFFPERFTFPTWIILSLAIATYTTIRPPNNPDPYHCGETQIGQQCK